MNILAWLHFIGRKICGFTCKKSKMYEHIQGTTEVRLVEKELTTFALYG